TERRVKIPRCSEIRSPALKRHVLNVLRKDKGAGFQHEYPAAVSVIIQEEPGRHHSTKRAAANYNGVESAGSTRDRYSGAVDRLLQRVAEKATHVVKRETCGLCLQSHDEILLMDSREVVDRGR